MLTMLCFGFATINSIAQEQEKKEITRPNHEINIGFSNFFNPYYVSGYPDIYPLEALAIDEFAPSNDLAYYPIYPYMPTHVRSNFGVGYKYHFGKNAARVRFGFRISNEKNENDPNADYRSFSEYNTNTYRVRAGIERSLLRLEKFDFYLGLDGIYARAEDKSKSTSTYNADNYSSEQKNHLY